jgi:hypothetical protein
VYNDAVFTEDDFKSIQRIGDSVKKTEETKSKIGTTTTITITTYTTSTTTSSTTANNNNNIANAVPHANAAPVCMPTYLAVCICLSAMPHQYIYQFT